MPALTAAKTTIVSLPVGQVINITGIGEWDFIALNPQGGQIDSGAYVNEDVIGVYTVVANVQITAAFNSSLSYNVATPSSGQEESTASDTGSTSGGTTLDASNIYYHDTWVVNGGGTVTLAADLASSGRKLAFVPGVGQPDFTIALASGPTVIQDPGTTLSSAEADARTVIVFCQADGVWRVESMRNQNIGSQGFILFGDSMQHRNIGTVNITALTRTGGVATATSAGHGLGSGQVTDINNAADATYNLRGVTITRVDANTFTYPCPGADGSTTAIAGKVMLGNNPAIFADGGCWPWLQGKLGGAGTFVRCAGVSSNTSADMLARVDADVLAYKSEWVLFQPGLYNDFNTQPGYDTYTAAACVAVCQQILNKLLADGRKVVLISPPALGTVGGATTKAVVLQKYLAVMRWMKAQADSARGAFYADAWRYSVDATNAAPGTALAGMLASDNIHEAPRAAERKAQAIFEAIGSLIPRRNVLTTGNGDNYAASSSNANLWDIGPWTATGGTVNAATGGGSASGVLPAGIQGDAVLTTGGTVVWSCPARADGLGFDVQAVVSAAANNDYVRIRAITLVPSSRFSAGHRLRPMFSLSLAGMNGTNAPALRAVNGLIVFAGGAANSFFAITGGADTAARFPQADQTLTIVGPDIIVPSDGITSFDLRVQLLFAGVSASALTARIGLLTVQNMSVA